MADQSDGDGYYKAYEEHTKTLRTWLVAYGAGAPVVLLANPQAAMKLTASHMGGGIAMYFLIGASLQVLLAAVNKAVMWACYYAAENPAETEGKKAYALAQRISRAFWIDLAVDVGSLVFFAYATWRAFRIILGVV